MVLGSTYIADPNEHVLDPFSHQPKRMHRPELQIGPLAGIIAQSTTTRTPRPPHNGHYELENRPMRMRPPLYSLVIACHHTIQSTGDMRKKLTTAYRQFRDQLRESPSSSSVILETVSTATRYNKPILTKEKLPSYTDPVVVRNPMDAIKPVGQ